VSVFSWPRHGLWRHADFLRLWAAQIVSAWGSRITRTALPIIAVAVLHQSDETLGLLGAVQIAPGIVLGLVIGGIIDRSHKRRLLIGADLIRAGLVASLTVAWWYGHLTMAHVLVVGAGVGAATTVFMITDNTYLPVLIGKHQLTDGNSKLEASEAVAEIAGPSGAGLLIGLLGAPLAVVIDAVTYLWSALCLALIRTPETPAAAGEPHDVVGDLRLGLSAIFSRPILRALLFAQMAWYLSSGFFIALYSPFCLRVLGLGPELFGFVIGFGGVGALLGALVARHIPSRLGLGPTMLVASGIGALGTLLIPLADGPRALVLAFLITHQIVSDGAMVVFQVHAVTTVQTLLPQQILGRTSAAFHVCSIGMMPIGSALAGILAGAFGTRNGLWIGLCAGLMSPILLSPLRTLRALPQGSDPGGRGNSAPAA